MFFKIKPNFWIKKQPIADFVRYNYYDLYILTVVGWAYQIARVQWSGY